MNGTTKQSFTMTAVSLIGVTVATAIHPALAQDALHAVQSIVTCGTATACVSGNNTGYGAGVAGISAKGNGVNGLSRATSGNSAAVYGNAVSNAAGVYGTSSHGYGMVAHSTSGDGLYAKSDAGFGIGMYGVGSSFGAEGYSPSGVGVYGQSTDGAGLIAYSHSLAGAEIFGGSIGIIGAAPAGAGTYPLILTDASNSDVFYVNGNGDVFYHGTISQMLPTTRGNVRAYGASSTTPSVEDVGSAALRNGSARVRLDPAFGRSINGSPYHVFLTPAGDTRGLFVAERDRDGFVVQEAQGGRGSLIFDYRIVATQSGHSTDRMAFTSPNDMPNAPIVKLPVGVPKPVVPAIIKP